MLRLVMEFYNITDRELREVMTSLKNKPRVPRNYNAKKKKKSSATYIENKRFNIRRNIRKKIINS